MPLSSVWQPAAAAANIITLCLHTTVFLQQRPTPLKKLLFHLSKGTSVGVEEGGSISGAGDISPVDNGRPSLSNVYLVNL